MMVSQPTKKNMCMWCICIYVCEWMSGMLMSVALVIRHDSLNSFYILHSSQNQKFIN